MMHISISTRATQFLIQLFAICFILVLLTSLQSNAQSFDNSQLVTRIWTHVTGNPGDTLNWTQEVIDNSRNVLIIGNSLQNNQTTDMLLTKYDGTDGSILWEVQYDNSGNDDFGVDVVCDPSRNIYTATSSYVSSTNGYDWVIQKYDSNGTALWTKTFNSGIYDVPTDMKYDGSGHLYVTGVRTGTTSLQDYCTIKYDASNGNTLWSAPSYYDYTNLIDIPAAVTISATGKIVVAGGSGSTLANWDFATIKYAPSTGAQTNATRNASNGLGFDQVTSIAKDQNDNIYIAGYAAVSGNGYDVKLAKLDTALNYVWVKTWDGGDHLNDGGNDVGVDVNGFVYVTGYTNKTNGGSDYITLKYNSSGTLQWSKRYAATDPTKSAKAKKLDIDPYGNVLITGDAFNIGNRDILTLAYDVNGNKKWEDWIGGVGNGDDYASGIKIDDATNYFYVTGKTWSGTQFQYTTSKYQMIDYMTPPDTEYCPNSFAYYENKGQLIDDTGAVRNDLAYYCQSDFPDLYFSNAKTSFQFYKHGNDSTILDSIFRVEMKFQSGLSSKVYSGGLSVPGYLNYFKPQCSTGATSVKGRQYLLMKEIYRNTDALYYGNTSGMKIYFNCYPGSSPSSIVLNFVGAPSVTIVGGSLKVSTPLGIVSFIAPKAYQIDASGNKVSVGFTPAYVSAGTNKISFTLGTYNTSLPLIIEMSKGIGGVRGLDDCPNNCEWSTFYEGTADVNSNVRSDKNGSAHVVGTAYNPDFANTAGVVQEQSHGFADALVEKFDIEGHRKWATYFGGEQDDYGTDIDIDSNGNVFFTGYTQSEVFLVLSSGNGSCYVQPAIGCSGCTNAFIVKLDSTAQTNKWSTYFGGNSTCQAYGLKVDVDDNVFICGPGKNVPVADSVGYFSSIGSGFVQKFSNDGVRVWGTTIGSASAVTKNPRNIDIGTTGIYVCGEIGGSGDLPLASNSYSGAYDAFIIAFNPATYAVNWSQYLGGTSFDRATSVVYLKPHVLISGRTDSDPTSFPDTNLPGTLDYFDGSFGGGFVPDIFIARFSEYTGTMDWCTYYGGSGYDQSVEMCSGIDANLQPCFYITGWSNSTDFPFPSNNLANAYVADSTNGQPKPFFSLFSNNLSIKWSTFFGGASTWGSGSGVAAYSNSKLFLTGNIEFVATFPFDDGTSVLFIPPDPYFFDSTLGNDGFLTRFDLGSVLVDVPEVETTKQNLLVYPNPTDGSISMAIDQLLEGDVSIIVTDEIGRKVIQKDETVYSNTPLRVDLSKLAAGIYFISVRSKNLIYSTKAIVQ